MILTMLRSFLYPDSAVALEAKAVARFNQAKPCEKDDALTSLVELLSTSQSFRKDGANSWTSLSGLVKIYRDPVEGYSSITIYGALPFLDYQLSPYLARQMMDRLLDHLPEYDLGKKGKNV